MPAMRPILAADARSFGKRYILHSPAGADRAPALGSDLRLFAATFLAGFVFVSVLIG